MPILRSDEFFGKRKRMSHEESRQKRFQVYDYIKSNQSKKITNLDLARAAGYKCELHSDEREYKRGLGFIDNMVRMGFISYTDYPDMSRLWYISDKDKDHDSSLRVQAIALPAHTSDLVARPVEEDALIAKEEPEEAVAEPAEEKDDFQFNCSVSLMTDAKHSISFDLEDTNLEALLKKIKSAVEVIR